MRMNTLQRVNFTSMSHFSFRLNSGLRFNYDKFVITLTSSPRFYHTHYVWLDVQNDFAAPQKKSRLDHFYYADNSYCGTHKTQRKFVNGNKQNSNRLFAVPASIIQEQLRRSYHHSRNGDIFMKNFSFGIRQFWSSDNNKNNNNNSSERSAAVVNLARYVLAETERVDVMAGSIPQSQVERVIENLLSLNFSPSDIKALLSGKLWLLRQTEATLTLCQLLLDHGLTPQSICQILDSVPLANQSEILTIRDKINQTLFFLRNFGFSEKEMFALLDKDAFVLFMDESLILAAFDKVKSFFPSALAKKVVCTSPNILYSDWSSTHAKFDYCVFIMGYNQSDIVKSRLFSHSLDHIQDRHIFLQRAGIFQVVNKKLHPSLNVNPPLKNVVDTPDSLFVKLIDGVSTQDYQVFKRMRDIERDNEEEEDGDDDDVHGSENYNNYKGKAYLDIPRRSKSQSENRKPQFFKLNK